MIRSIQRGKSTITGKEEVVVVPTFKGTRRFAGPAKKLDVLCRSALSNAVKNGRFAADAGETMLLTPSLPKAPLHVLLLGFGERSKLDPETVAAAAGAASRLLKKHRFASAHVLFGEPFDDELTDLVLHPFIKGFSLAQYAFTMRARSARSAQAKTVGKLVIMADHGTRVADTIRRAKIVVEYTEKVRDMVNLPANALTPRTMAEEAKALATKNGLRCTVKRARELQKLGMGAIIDVGKGSREESCLITLHYNKGRRDVPRVCLVGKGVTFDSGGISIKPWNDMNEMKGDMAGGAVVIASIVAASRLNLPVEIIGLIPCVENMPDGVAFRPGDIVTTYSGRTIEILSTDAEGRLILSDALAYANESDPDVIVDFATLTGAVVIALGTRIAGVMGTSQQHIDTLVQAGERAGEPVWQLPLDDRFRDMVKGDISDYKNYSGRDGSTITAAALLAEFVGDTPWVHVDIAGTFWGDGKVPYQTKGATGYGVDLTLRFLESLA